MPTIQQARRCAIAAVFLSLAVGVMPWSVGCAPKPAAKPGLTVTGKIIRDGQPLPLDPARAAAAADYVQLSFQKLGENDAVTFMNSTAVTNIEGVFTIKSLEPGTYRICVEHMTEGNDALGGRFATKSPIKIDIESDLADLVIDLAEYAKPKKK